MEGVLLKVWQKQCPQINLRELHSSGYSGMEEAGPITGPASSNKTNLNNLPLATFYGLWFSPQV
jgi:hypothetical protein